MELNTNYDSRTSFYGKARVRTEGDRMTLISYSTEVCYIENGKAVILGWHSATTGRHLKEFLKQNDFKAESKAQMLEDYGK
jgi:hypothetical protein